MLKALRMCGLALICALLAGPAFADDGGWGNRGNDQGGWNNNNNNNNNCNPTPPSCNPSPPNCNGGGAPEIDPNSLAGALTLLSGGFLVLTDRFRKKK